MKRAIWIGVLAVLGFAVFLLIRLPAGWLAGSLPKDITCGQITGTVWNGACGALAWQNTAMGDLNWQLEPIALLSGNVSSQVALNGPMGVATGQVAVNRDGKIALRNLQGSFPLDPALLTAVPPNVRGNVQTKLGLLRIEDGLITAIEGRIDVRDLEQRGTEPLRLGDYVVTFPSAITAEPVGDVRSVNGPFELQGELRLTPEPGFVLEGRVKASSSASPELAQELTMLGRPDAQGRRPFSIAGTF
jgi:general secretion pathway protein N